MALITERQKCAHVLRRFGLGASESELDFYLKGGLESGIDLLLNFDQTQEGFDLPIEAMANAKNGNVNPQAVSVWWTARMLTTSRPLQEKMTLFWHDHFATSGSKVLAGLWMHRQNEILRANCTGNFRTMLHEVSKDPAMLFWLDNQFNVKAHPNENFAREVMELFTLGIGNYNEKDVQEGARSFTGWSIQRGNGKQLPADGKGLKRGDAEFIFRPFLHDDGGKSYLGQSGNFNGDNVIDMLCDKPRTAWYITKKLWEWFVYENPDDALVDRFSAKFQKSGLNIKLLLRNIMTSPEFYSEKAERGIYKCPADFCVATLRQLGVGQMVAQQIASSPTEGPKRMPAAQLTRVKMKDMGMEILYPPDVSGWDGGANWVTSATMVERIEWGQILFGTGGRYNLRYPVAGLLQNDMTPKGVVAKLISVFDAPIPPDKVQRLVAAAQRTSGGSINAQNVGETAAIVAKLIFASPEFQFS
jgi:uncharacterized protein (DUF1800 family)